MSSDTKPIAGTKQIKGSRNFTTKMLFPLLSKQSGRLVMRTPLVARLLLSLGANWRNQRKCKRPTGAKSTSATPPVAVAVQMNCPQVPVPNAASPPCTLPAWLPLAVDHSRPASQRERQRPPAPPSAWEGLAPLWSGLQPKAQWGVRAILSASTGVPLAAAAGQKEAYERRRSFCIFCGHRLGFRGASGLCLECAGRAVGTTSGVAHGGSSRGVVRLAREADGRCAGLAGRGHRGAARAAGGNIAGARLDRIFSESETTGPFSRPLFSRGRQG